MTDRVRARWERWCSCVCATWCVLTADLYIPLGPSGTHLSLINMTFRRSSCKVPFKSALRLVYLSNWYQKHQGDGHLVLLLYQSFVVVQYHLFASAKASLFIVFYHAFEHFDFAQYWIWQNRILLLRFHGWIQCKRAKNLGLLSKLWIFSFASSTNLDLSISAEPYRRSRLEKNRGFWRWYSILDILQYPQRAKSTTN